jgi:multisubunit Na+/H+ antiporter MnhB subunit
MKPTIIDAFARAFGVFVFVVVFLWIGHKDFPSGWSALAVLYLVCIPLAAVYGWLVRPQSGQASSAGRGRVSRLLLIGIAVAVAIVGYAAFKAEVDGFFFEQRR